MKKPQVGLVLEGDASNSALLNLPGLGSNVDVVKSSSLRSARRFANAFRLGKAVDNYEALQGCRLVLIKVPDSELPRILAEFSSAAQDAPLPPIAACETWISADMLREAGVVTGKIATATSIPSPLGRWFIAEGDTAAVRLLRRLLEDCGAKVLPIDQGTKSLYFAAELMTTAAPLPYLFSAQALLRRSGLSGKLLASVLEQLLAKMSRNFRAGHRLALAGPEAHCARHISSEHLARAQAAAPEILHLLEQYRRYADG